jgi:hypothetical protein
MVLETSDVGVPRPRTDPHPFELDPQARAELERLATIDRRSIASAASLLLEASLRARTQQANPSSAAA